MSVTSALRFRNWGSPLVTKAASLVWTNRKGLTSTVKGIPTAFNLNQAELGQFKTVLEENRIIKPKFAGCEIEDVEHFHLSVILSRKKLVSVARDFRQRTGINIYASLLDTRRKTHKAIEASARITTTQDRETVTKNKGAILLALRRKGQEEIGKKLIEEAESIVRLFDRDTHLESLYYTPRKIANMGGNTLAVVASLLQDIPLESLMGKLEEREGSEIYKRRETIIKYLRKFQELKDFSFSAIEASKDPKYIAGKMKELVLRSRYFETLLIFFLDRLREARKIPTPEEGKGPPEKDEEFLDQIRLIYAPLAERLQFIFLADDFRDQWLRISDPKKYREIEENVVKKKIGMTYDEAKEYLSKFVDRLQVLLGSKAPKDSKAPNLLSDIITIFWRVKSPYSIYNKVEVRKDNAYDTYDKVRDILGIKIVCESIENIDAIAEGIREKFGARDEDIDDYVTRPRDSGFQAYSITIYDKGRPIEIQIMTEAMDEFNTHDKAGTWINNLSKEMRRDDLGEYFDTSMAPFLNGVPDNNFRILFDSWEESEIHSS